MQDAIYEKRIEVIGASKYDFTNDNGEQVKGCKVQVLSTSDNENQIGSSVYSINLPYEEFKKFEFAKFPVKCVVKFKITDFSKRPIIESVSLV